GSASAAALPVAQAGTARSPVNGAPRIWGIVARPPGLKAGPTPLRGKPRERGSKPAQVMPNSFAEHHAGAASSRRSGRSPGNGTQLRAGDPESLACASLISGRIPRGLRGLSPPSPLRRGGPAGAVGGLAAPDLSPLIPLSEAERGEPDNGLRAQPALGARPGAHRGAVECGWRALIDATRTRRPPIRRPNVNCR